MRGDIYWIEAAALRPGVPGVAHLGSRLGRLETERVDQLLAALRFAQRLGRRD